MSDKPKTVSVTALQYHTFDGKAYHEGDTYDVDEAQCVTLAALEFAKPTDQVKAEQKAAKKAEADEKPAAAPGRAKR